MAGVERGRELVELALETVGLIAGEQALAPAAARDEDRCSQAKPAGKKCTGCVAHPHSDFRERFGLRDVRRS
jgi:hypothetical protein